MSKTNTDKISDDIARHDEEIKMMKKVLLKFIHHIKRSGKLGKFDPLEADELIDIACNWEREDRSNNPADA